MANFIELKSSKQLAELIDKSNHESVVLFKHSLTCPISTSVYNEVSDVEADVNLVIMQKSREISNEIAQKTGIRHESPQAIVLKNGKAVYHASHYEITAEDIEISLESRVQSLESN
ncbi:MAG: bacillithiol system redox-active protein YtxJ [Actinomycetota bacterium]